MGVDRDRTSELGTHQLGHERNAAGTADEKDRIDLLGLDASRGERPTKAGDCLLQGRADALLEFIAGDPDVFGPAGEVHTDARARVVRQRLLGLDAFSLHSSSPTRSVGIIQIERAERASERLIDVPHDGGVEVDAADPLDALRLTEDGETLALRTQHGGVERAAPEVVDGDDRTGRDPIGGRVLGGGGHRFGHEDHLLDTGHTTRVTQQIDLVRTPVRGMGHGHQVGPAAFAFGDEIDHGTEKAPG